jgi:hypothetical protein
MATLEGLEQISPGRNIQLTPYGTFAGERSIDPATLNPTRYEDRSVGLDAKIVVKNAVTIDAAVNPDFSEVESDDPLVTVNQRFEVFRPEKRPLFMENAPLFAMPITLFFSRRIAYPELGIGLISRSTGWAIGGLIANDRAVGPDEPGGFFGQGAAIGVARIQRQFGDRSNVGVLTTERDDGRTRNRVVSADGRLQMSPTWSFSGQAVQSDNNDQTGQQSGSAYAGTLSRSGPHFTYVGSYRDLGSTLLVPLGYVPRTDIRAVEQYAGYVWHVGDSGVWSVGPAVSAVVDWNHTGQLQDRWMAADVGISRAGYLDTRVSRSQAYELYGATPFHRDTTNMSVSSRPLSWLSIWGQYSWGTAINYTPAVGVAPFLGPRRGAYASVTLRPWTRLRVEQILLHEQMAGEPPAPTQMVFETTMIRWKANLQITRALALRGIVDYNQLTSNPLLFSQPPYSLLMGDMLFTYLVHPGTAIYMGFNRRYENLLVTPGSDIPIEHAGAPTFPVGRQIFVKVSYLFRF